RRRRDRERAPVQEPQGPERRARPAGEHLARGERGNAARGDEALSGDQGPGEGPGGRGARAPAAPGAHLPRAGRRVSGHGRPASRLRDPDDAGARLWRRTVVRPSLGCSPAEAVHSLVIAVAPRPPRTAVALVPRARRKSATTAPAAWIRSSMGIAPGSMWSKRPNS